MGNSNGGKVWVKVKQMFPAGGLDCIQFPLYIIVLSSTKMSISQGPYKSNFERVSSQ